MRMNTKMWNITAIFADVRESAAGKMLELPNNIFYMYRLYAEDIKFYGQWSVWIY